MRLITLTKAAAAAASVAALAAGGALAAEKTALVVANADYQHGPAAKSAARDGKAVATALSKAGFAVIAGEDLDREGMRALLERFAEEADDAEQIVVFVSGHAMRMQGETFLAPTDFEPDDEVAVALDGVPLAAILALAARTPGAAVAFIDGAQRDGFEPTAFAEPGLAEIVAPEGVLVVSAAAPGEAVSRSRWFSSAFSKAVVEEFLAEGAAAMEVAAALDAPIWTTGEVEDNLILHPQQDVSEEDDASPGVAQEIELAFWRSVEAGGDKADYEAYLRRYPEGSFAAIARNRIGAKEETANETAATPAPPTAADRAEAAEQALGLSRAQRREVQRDLTELGYDTRGVDGLFGRGTRGALRRWQESENLPSTGFLNASQTRLLARTAAQARTEREAAEAEAKRLSAAEAREKDDALWRRAERANTESAYQRYLNTYPEGAHAAEARDILSVAAARAEREAWGEAERRDDVAAYENYLDRFPEGDNAARAERRLERLGAAPGRDGVEAAWIEAQRVDTADAYAAFRDAYPDSRFADEAEEKRVAAVVRRRKDDEAALGLSRDSWFSIEQRLAALGFDPGAQDGAVDRATRGAIRSYRRSRGLEPHRFADRPFIERLVAETEAVNPGAAIVNELFRALQQ